MEYLLHVITGLPNLAPDHLPLEGAQPLLHRPPPDTSCTGRSCTSRNLWTSQCCDRASGGRSYSFGKAQSNSIPAMCGYDQCRNVIFAAVAPWAQSSATHSFRSTNTCSRESRDRTLYRRCTFHISAFPLSYRLLFLKLIVEASSSQEDAHQS